MRWELRRLRVSGLYSLADVVLEPGRLTVLIGANGSGKSNVLGALAWVLMVGQGRLQHGVGAAGGASSLLHYGPKRTQVMVLELELGSGEARCWYRAELAYGAGERLFFADEAVGYAADGGAASMASLGAGHMESLLPAAAQANDAAAQAALEGLRGIAFVHVHDTSRESMIRAYSRVEDDRTLHPNGANLGAWLSGLRQSGAEGDQKAWRRINLMVRRVVPSVRTLDPVVLGNGMVRLDWIDDQGERFGVHRLSDGTLRALALIAALAQPTERLPGVLAVDEPELGLHPSALRLIAELARSVSRHVQVVFATQSPAFLDHFDPGEVVVVEREAGTSVLRRLDAATLAGWLEEYSLSEVYDKGLLGGRP